MTFADIVINYTVFNNSVTIHLLLFVVTLLHFVAASPPWSLTKVYKVLVQFLKLFSLTVIGIIGSINPTCSQEYKP